MNVSIDFKKFDFALLIPTESLYLNISLIRLIQFVFISEKEYAVIQSLY